MTWSKEKTNQLVKWINEEFPDWAGFNDPRFEEAEIGYKQQAVTLFEETLNKTEFSTLINREDWDEIKRRLVAVAAKTNLLFQGTPNTGDLAILYIDATDLSILCPEIFKLLYGEESVESRLEIFSQFAEQNGLPNKWTFATYFLFMAHPETEILIKPQIASWFLKFAESNIKLGSKPDGGTYVAFKRLIDELKSSLEPDFSSRDMVDLQSLIWVAKSRAEKSGKKESVGQTELWCDTSPKGNVWKIAPGRKAHWWDVWKERGIAAIGWKDTGDLRAFQSFDDFKEFKKQREQDGEKIDGGADQAWRFAHLIKPGDTIIANKGKSEILGIGTVTGDYRFVETDDYAHQRDVTWHEIETKSIDRQNGWVKTLVQVTQDEYSQLILRTGKDHLFTPLTFELLQDLHKQPYKKTIQKRKEGYENAVQKPLQELLQSTIDNLPNAIKDAMKTDAGLYSRLGKNDFGQGGAWDFYWGAIYDPASKRTHSVQLFCMVNKDGLKCGFSLGSQSAKTYKDRFRANVKQYREELEKLLEPSLSMEGLEFEIDGDFSHTWRDWLGKTEVEEWQDVEYKLPVAIACQLTKQELVQTTTSIFNTLYPLVILSVSNDPVPKIAEYLDIENEECEIQPAYPLVRVEDQTGIEIDTLKIWIEAIQRKKQAVFYGPPGTGKTFIAQELAKYLVSETDGFSNLVQFHPAYEYEDFITGIRPIATDSGLLNYEQVPGRFLNFCAEAKKRSGLCVLIIDEINRANLSRVFGELMYLLEYRDQKVPLASGLTLRIPDNVRIIGTMNTADRSIALVDHALRRRFAFLELRPNYNALSSYHETSDYDVGPLITILKELNNQIDDRNYEIGISFFIDDELETNLPSIWQLEIEPYLDEYFLGQSEKITPFRWSSIRERLID